MKQFYETLDQNVRNNCWLLEFDEEDLIVKTRYGSYSDVRRYNRGRTTEKKFDSLVKAKQFVAKKGQDLLKKGLQLSDWELPLRQAKEIEEEAKKKTKKLRISLSTEKGLRAIGQLAHLEYLNIDTEDYRQTISFPEDTFTKLTKLKKLTIDAIVDIPKSLLSCKELEELNLSNSGPIPLFIGDLTSLVNLEISTDESSLPLTIGKLKKLKKLELSASNLIEIPSTIGQLKALEEFEFNYSILTSLPDEFGELENLEILELKNAKLTGLPASFKRLQKLEVINFYSNPFNHFPAVLTELKQLKKLDISHCNINSLPDSIKILEELINLNLYYNPLEEGLGEGFFELKNLQRLNLTYTSLAEIPRKIGQLKQLKYLDAKGCKAANIPNTILGAGKDAIFEYLGLKEEEVFATLENKLSPAETASLLDKKRASIQKYQEDAHSLYENNLNLERIINFITFKSDKIPTINRAEFRRHSHIVALLSPIDEWTDFDHRIMTIISGENWCYSSKNRVNGQEKHYGFYSRFYNRCQEDYSDTTFDFTGFVAALAPYGIDIDNILQFGIADMDQLFFADKNYKSSSFGDYVAEALKNDPDKILTYVKKGHSFTSFGRLLAYNFKKLRNKHVPDLLLFEAYDGFIAARYQLLEALCLTDLVYAKQILINTIERTTQTSSRASLGVLMKQYLPEENALSFQLVTEGYNCLADDAFTIYFSKKGDDDEISKYLDETLELFGSDIKNQVIAHMVNAKTISARYCEIIAKHYGQEGIEAIIEGLNMTKDKVSDQHFRKMFALLAPFDISVYYEKVWALLEWENQTIQTLAAEELIKRKIEDIEARANTLLKDKNKTNRIGGALLLKQIGSVSSIQSLKEHIDKEKTEDVRDVLVDCLYDREAAINKKEALRRVAATKARGKLKNPAAKWLLENKLPSLYWNDGKKLDEDSTRFLFYKQKNKKELRLDTETAPIYKLIDQEKSPDFAKALLVLIQKNGDFYAKNRFAFVPMLTLGDDSLIAPIKKFCFKKDNATAPTLIGMLRSMGAARALNDIMERYKTKYPNVREAASDAFDEICDSLGSSRSELLDAMIPDFGFKGLFYHFEVGGDGFHAFLTQNGGLNYYEKATGKIRKSVPAKADKAVKEHLKQVGKEIKGLMRQQKKSLESYMVFQRRWTVEQWRSHFMLKPVPFVLAQGLIWGIYDVTGKLLNSFSVLEDQDLEDIEYEPIALTTDQYIGILHRLDLAEEAVEKWNENLSDSEVAPPFNQFQRPIFKPTEAEKAIKFIHAYDKLKMSAFRGKAERAGWRRGSVVDGGAVSSYLKEFPQAGVDIYIEIEGMSVSSWEDYDDITIQNAYFIKHGSLRTGSYYYNEPTEEKDERLLSIGDVPPVIYSEVVADLKRFTEQKEK